MDDITEQSTRNGDAQGGSPLSSSSGLDATIFAEELEFEDVFLQCGSANATADSTPRTSFVGPSALPSPGESPAYQMSLLALTETSDKEVKIYKTEDAESIEKEIPNPLDPLDNSTAIKKKIRSPNEELNSSKFDDHTPTVVTHIETETSAAATKRRLGPHDFELMRVVGQGAFGKVFQVRKRDTQEIFAMKVMRKDRILERSHGEYVRAERDALTAVVHPYIVTLRAGTFSEQLAKLYTAELVLAVAYLHSQGFVHRDLKPENVLLDSEGHVKITDFGLAKGNLSDAEGQRTNSFIGTMEYMAPEIIAGKGHGKAVDWWSVGILLYEMLCGMPPFRSKSRPSLQKLILSAKVKFPSYLSGQACGLLRALLQKETSKRLGFGPKGSADIMSHDFFKGIDWKKLEARQIPSPFKPTIRSHDSIENFDKIWTDLPVQDSPCSTPQSRSLDDKTFEGFTYCAPSVLAAAMDEQHASKVIQSFHPSSK